MCYLCSVFFIVLDLRLTKVWGSAESHFLFLPVYLRPVQRTQHVVDGYAAN